MPVCERCGATFPEPKTPVAVTSSRILCPVCTEIRLAEKRAAAAAGPHGTAAPATRSVASPARVAAPAAKGAAPATRIAPPAPSLPPKRTTPRDEPAAAGSRHAPRKKAPAAEDRNAVLDRSSKIGLIIAISALVIAGGVAGWVWNKKAGEAAAVEARNAEVEKFLKEMRAIDIASENGATQAILMAELKKDLWLEEVTAADVNSILLKARGFVAALKDKKDFEGRLSGFEAQAAELAKMSSSDISELRRRVNGLKGDAEALGPEYLARVRLLAATTTRAYAGKLREEALAYAEARPDDPRDGLVYLQKAEDETWTLLVEATRNDDRESMAVFTNWYQGLQTKSDQLCKAAFPPEVVEKTSWTDLLAPERAGKWLAPRALPKGSSWSVKDGTLVATGPDAGVKAQLPLSIGDEDKYRDFVVEADFVVEKGVPSFFFRLGVAPDNNTEGIKCDATADSGMLEAGKAYAFTVTYIGSTFSVRFRDDVPAPYERVGGWSKQRKGAIGIVLPAESAIKVTRLRIKILR